MMKYLIYTLCMFTLIACQNRKESIKEESSPTKTVQKYSDKEVIQELKKSAAAKSTSRSISPEELQADYNFLYHLDNFTIERKTYSVFDLKAFQANSTKENLASCFSKPEHQRFFIMKNNNEMKHAVLAEFDNGHWISRIQYLNWGELTDWLPTILKNLNTQKFEILSVFNSIFIYIQEDKDTPYYQQQGKPFSENEFYEHICNGVKRLER